MRNLKIEEVLEVKGGDGEVATIKEITKIAEETCGQGNVKSVTTKGYECK
ncbi:hypothetical protein [Aquimarina longa]|nr:hypothetical protein [Aquimarina longa]